MARVSPSCRRTARRNACTVTGDETGEVGVAWLCMNLDDH